MKRIKSKGLMPMAIFLVLGLAMSGCGEREKEEDDIASCDAVSRPMTTRFNLPPTCTTSANYTVVFNSTWSARTHPRDFPQNPHFSGLIGATHNGKVRFWQSGKQASAGIECMAETGNKNALVKEIEIAKRDGNAGRVLSGGGIGNSPGQVSLSFEISEKFPLVTLVSMIAPSPDWFVGVSGTPLCDNGTWVNKTLDLFAYDAGTDSGRTYTAPNQDTQPQAIIGREFNIFSPVTKLGTFTFTKQ